MPQNDKRIQVGCLDHRIDAGKASKAFRSGPGKLVVEMLPPPTRIGNLVVPESVQGNLRSDVGVVLTPSFGTRIEGRNDPTDRGTQGQTVWSPDAGELVCLLPYEGFWFEAADLGSYRTENQVRAFGHYCEEQGRPDSYPWWQAIPCSIEPKSMTIKEVFGDMVVFRPDEREDRTVGGVYLPHTAQRVQMAGTVVGAGPLAGVSVGERFLFDPRAVEEERYGFDLSEELKDLYAMSARGILVVLNEAVAA